MQAERKWRLIRFAVTAVVLFAVWLLFTASLGMYSLVMGMIGSVFIAALTYDVFIAQHQANLRFFVPRPLHLAVYLIILIISFYTASARVLVAVLTGKVNPRIIHFRTRLRSDFARMVLAVSITFTPGTITLDLNDDHLTVHWLFCSTTHKKAAGEAVKGRLEKYLQRVWM